MARTAAFCRGPIGDMDKRNRDIRFIIGAIQLTILSGYFLFKFVFMANGPWNFFAIGTCVTLGSTVVWCWYHAIRGFRVVHQNNQAPERSPPPR